MITFFTQFFFETIQNEACEHSAIIITGITSVRRLFLARQDVDKKSRQGKKILLRKRKAMICEGRTRKKEEVE